MNEHPMNEAIREALARARNERPPRDVVATEKGPVDLPEGERVTVTVPGNVIEDIDGNPIGVEPNDVQEYVVGRNGVLTRWNGPAEADESDDDE